MLGTGVLEEKIRKKIRKLKLEDVIEVVGQVPSDKVKYYMENANIFIGTSDSQEGWGVVINEAMNTGCAIVANKKMGSVPLLIKDNLNGFMYSTYNDLENKIKSLILDKLKRQKFGINAYKYITTYWESSIAAQNLLDLFESILYKKDFNVQDGPASKA